MPATRVESTSFLYRSAPYEAQGTDFINAVARIATGLTAPDLLVALQALEAAAGRERPYLNAPRTLDLDLIFYGQACVDSPALTYRQRVQALAALAEEALDPPVVSAACAEALA